MTYSPIPENLIHLNQCPLPNRKELWQFVGLPGYYWNCINPYSDITHALTRLLRKYGPYIWRNNKVFSINPKDANKGHPFSLTQTQINHTLYSQMPPNILGVQHYFNPHPNKIPWKTSNPLPSSLESCPVHSVIMLHLSEDLLCICLLKDSTFTCKMQNEPYCLMIDPLEKLLKWKTENNKINNWSIEFPAINWTFST